MPLTRFTLYTAVGSGAYNTVLVSLGHLLGSRWRTVGRYSDYINYTVIAAVAVSIAVFVVRRYRRG